MARQRGEDGLQMVLLCQSSGERRLAELPGSDVHGVFFPG